MLRHLLGLPLLVFGATAALAQDDAMCRSGLFPDESQFALARVGGRDRAYFNSDEDGCPLANTADCRTDTYLVPGDTIVISRNRGRFACAFFPDDAGGTAGWIETKRVLLQPLKTQQPLEAWLGKWTSSGNPTVRFRKDLGALRVEGEAFWPGPPGSHDWPSTHEGAIAGRVELTGYRVSYRDENLCEVRFTLLGDFLIASDNRRCGGANVSFSGVYSRVQH